MDMPNTKPPVISKEAVLDKVKVAKKGWFQKIPTDVLLSPAGMVLIAFAGFMELLDLIPIPIADQIWEIPLEIIFIVLLVQLAHVSLKSCVIPFFAERIISLLLLGADFVPTWLIRMFI